MGYRVSKAGALAVLLNAATLSSAGVPYGLPGEGEVVTIGANTAAGLASVFPASAGNSFFASIFTQYGSGVYVRDYSPHGAYVVAGTGGHAAPFQLTGAVLFDFEDATWKGFENSNDVPSYLGQATGQGNSPGEPWWEWTGSEVPLPGHTYLIPAELPASLGGGPQGSVLFLSHAATLSTGGGGRGPHVLNLATRRWSRLTSASQPSAGNIYTSVVFDEVKGRYYPVGDIEKTQRRMYYDAAGWDSVHYTAPSYAWTPHGGGSRAFLDSVRRLIIDFNDAGFLYAFQLDNPGASWTVLKVSGRLPAPGVEPCRWAYYPPDGRFYFRPIASGGSKVYRLTPPPSDPLAAAWVADSIRLDRDMPDCSGSAWYNYLFYVPSLKCLAWIPNANSPVYLFKPPAAGTSIAKPGNARSRRALAVGRDVPGRSDKPVRTISGGPSAVSRAYDAAGRSIDLEIAP